jgi:hypothetical protein
MEDSPTMSAKVWRSILAVVALGLAALLVISCGDSSETESPSETVSPTTAASPSAAPSNTVWLCRPGLADNPCESDLTTTVESADGSTTVEQATPAEDPPIDCFYVYPTVSSQQTENANLDIDPDEVTVAVTQASRFSQLCRVYAPMYRQLTLSSIGKPGGASAGARSLAYGDVLSAWQDYLANYNDGRGVVLIGHSQGTGMLTQLIAAEIDTDSDQLASCLGASIGNVTVAAARMRW